MQCGGSDAFSGVTANPAVGYASDLLVRCGATVMFSEVTEVRDAIHLLTPRAINEEVGKRLLEEMARYDNYLDMGKTDRSANPSPATRKAVWPTWWKKRWGRLPNQGKAPSLRCSLRAASDQTRPHLRRNPRQRFCLRHPAGSLWHHGAGIHHRSRYAVRADGSTGDKNGDPYRAGQPLV